MDWEDSVMNDNGLDNCRQPGGLPLYDLREVARRQAEESFKAGRKEVVEWFFSHERKDYPSGYGIQVELDELKAQLEVWGIASPVRKGEVRDE